MSLTRLPRFLILLLALPTRSSAGPDKEWVKFSTRAEGEATQVIGENLHPWAPYHVQVSFSTLENLRTSVPLPARVVIPAGSRKTLLTLTPVDPMRGNRMAVSYLYGKGDPDAVPDPNAVHLFPYEHGTKRRVDQGYFGATTHRDLKALDFEMAEGTRICAARSGVVIGVKQDETRGGMSAAYAFRANYVDVLHEDGTWANYAHLKYKGALVRVGDRVVAGQVIGLSGSTGMVSGPHLHFSVYKANWEREGGETIPTTFAHLDGTVVQAEEGKTYYAVHPGGKPFTPKLGSRLTDADYEAKASPVRATNKVTLRTETVDDKLFFFAANGTHEAQDVTISFDDLRGFAVSKPVPYTKRIQGRTEEFLLSLSRSGPGRASYGVRYAWKRAARSP